ncbi:hypothetical protein HOLleu_24805 [Holothuria leucospilota]|uniref:Uncharacterized protein n=1 Tax=Holothuria leucospilota TaxID=206669 RepID=A0A9Q1H3H9_HOLLE|nr:hypothetical protein HOLleu_24805 [Holothuria leucospilota]
MLTLFYLIVTCGFYLIPQKVLCLRGSKKPDLLAGGAPSAKKKQYTKPWIQLEHMAKLADGCCPQTSFKNITRLRHICDHHAKKDKALRTIMKVSPGVVSLLNFTGAFREGPETGQGGWKYLLDWQFVFIRCAKSVDEHKTASSHGPARLVFSAEVYRVAKVYADHGRVQTANADIMDVMKSESPFFLDNKGREVTRVAQTVYRLWKSRGFSGSLNPTHLRYTAATKV